MAEPDDDITKARELAQRPITDQNHGAALELVDRLMKRHWQNSDVAVSVAIDHLAKVIQAYEDEAYPLLQPTPVEMIEHLLEVRGMSQDEFAQAIGLSASSVSSILSQERTITVDQAIAFGKFFSVDPSLFDAELAPL